MFARASIVSYSTWRVGVFCSTPVPNTPWHTANAVNTAKSPVIGESPVDRRRRRRGGGGDGGGARDMCQKLVDGLATQSIAHAYLQSRDLLLWPAMLQAAAIAHESCHEWC
jgi:hypothetical protein